MKKDMRLLYGVLIAALFLCLTCAAASAETVNGLTIEEINGLMTVTAFDGSVTDVVVPEGVEAIKSYVFREQTALTSVSLPSTLRTIGSLAFYGCENLSSLTMQEGLETIESSAFYNCSSLTSLTLPSTVKKIGDKAFMGETGLTSVVLPENITSFTRSFSDSVTLYVSCESQTAKAMGVKEGYSHNAFADPRWPDFQLHYRVSEDAQTYDLMLDQYTGTAAEVTLPQAVTGIDTGAFRDNTTLKKITLPEGLKELGKSTFYGCTALESIVVPENVTAIAADTFSGCRSLTSVSLPEGIKTIGTYAFYNCVNLSSINFPSALQMIDDCAFEYCKKLTSAVLPEGMTVLDQYAFDGCISLRRVTLPSTLTTLGYGAFNDCTMISSVTLPENMTSVSWSAFEKNVLLYVSRESATAKAMAQKPNYSFLSFVDPQWPDFQIHYRIDEYTGAYDLMLDKYIGTGNAVVTIPDGFAAIGYQAFYGHTNDYTTEYSSYDQVITEIHVPDSVTELGFNAIIGYGALKHVYLPDNIDTWGNYVFSVATNTAGERNVPILHCSYGSETAYGISACDIELGFTDPADPTFSWHYAAADSTDLKLVRYWGTEEGLTLPDNVVSIAANTFRGSKTLKKVVLPDALTELGEYAFYECTALESIDVPKNITVLGRQTFYGCKALTDVSLPSGLTELGYEVFGDCTALREVVLPENITTIGSMPFRFNSDVRLYVSRDSITAKNLGYSSSSYAIPFVDPEWPDFKLFYLTTDTEGEYRLGLGKYIGENQKTIIVPEGIEILGRGAFDGYDGNGNLDQVVEEIRLPDTVTQLEYNAITGYEALERVYLPDDITTWGNSAITDYMEPYVKLYCTPGSATAHGVSDYTSLPFVDVDQPDWGWRCGENDELLVAAYYGTDRHITLPAGGKGIADNTFDGGYADTNGVLSVTVPEGYETIGKRVFPSCLEYISLPEGLTTIGERAFSNSHIRSIQLPSTLTTIGEDAFWDCDQLQTLTIPAGVTSLPHSIAYSAEDLHTVVIPRQVTSIADDAFTGSVTQVYCYYNSAAYKWAMDTARYPVLLDGLDFAELVTMDLDRPEVWVPDLEDDQTVADAGTTAFWRGRVAIAPMPLSGGYTAVCTSSDPSVAKVEGDFVTYLKPGTVTLTYSVREIPGLKKTEKVTVYKPVEDFDVPSVMMIPLNDWRNVQKVTNIKPAGANPYFSWTEAGEYEYYHFYYDGLENLEISPENTTGIRILKVRSVSGVAKAVKVIDYGTISDIKVSAPGRSLYAGEVFMPLVQVKVDNMYFAYEPALYTLTSSNRQVVRPTADGRLQGMRAGTATITAKAVISGKTAQFSVTVTGEEALILPTMLSDIQANAFENNGASTIIVPDGCESIGARAFADSTKLKEIIIPASVEEIAEDAFEGCSGVTVIAPYGSTAHTFAQSTEGLTWQEGM